jgi:hypothetical protein
VFDTWNVNVIVSKDFLSVNEILNVNENESENVKVNEIWRANESENVILFDHKIKNNVNRL